MEIEIHHSFDSGLPPDDDHPYRTGVWQPQTTEYDAWDLDVVGEIPTDLAGTYLRNTENPRLESPRMYHPFDGDGMLHSMTFADGEARYANRFVRTEGFVAELETNRNLWSGLAERVADAERSSRYGARPAMKDASSTDVVVHNGRALSSFYLCGELYSADPVTLESHGPETFGGAFPAEGVSAHPKVDEHSGELLFFNYGTDAPYMHYGEVSAAGELSTYHGVELPGPRLPHDMAFTENFAIVNDCPLFWDPEALKAGFHAARFHPDMPTRFGIIPRGQGLRVAEPKVQWFEADPTFVLHWTNAYEHTLTNGDVEIVLDGYFQHDPAPAPNPAASAEDNIFRFLDMHKLQARAHRWRFNLTTGSCSEASLSDRVIEFPMINGRHAGRRHRYSWNALPCQGWFGFEGIVKTDWDTGVDETLKLPDGVFASETVMAPRIGSQAEDDGYLLNFVSDMNANRSECLILRADDITGEPVARVSMPERVSSGTHATWSPAS